MQQTRIYKKLHKFLVDNEIQSVKSFQLSTHIQYTYKTDEFHAERVIEQMILLGYLKKNKELILINPIRLKNKRTINDDKGIKL